MASGPALCLCVSLPICFCDRHDRHLSRGYLTKVGARSQRNICRWGRKWWQRVGVFGIQTEVMEILCLQMTLMLVLIPFWVFLKGKEMRCFEASYSVVGDLKIRSRQ